MRRTMQRTAAILMAALAVLALNGSTLAERERDTEEISAGGVMLMDACTHKVLYAKNAHEKLPMASTTKIMTAILAIETGKLDALVTVPKEAYGVEGSSMYLRLGEKISLRDLVYGLMLVSGNDAAVAIAINVGGSIAGFAALMNEKAKALGAQNTHFVTPNGLHDAEHYTTAYDLALIASYAMQNETFREIVGTTYYRTVTGEITRTVKNKNKILWEYEGGNGVKTGYTMAAGKCLVFSAERKHNRCDNTYNRCYYPFCQRAAEHNSKSSGDCCHRNNSSKMNFGFAPQVLHSVKCFIQCNMICAKFSGYSVYPVNSIQISSSAGDSSDHS